MLDKEILKKALKTAIQNRNEELTSLCEYNGFTEEDNNEHEALTKRYQDTLTSLEKTEYIEKEEYLRLAADFDNFKKRTSRDKVDIMNQANKDIIEDLLTIVDDMERLLFSLGVNNASREGFKLIYDNMLKLLDVEGCVKIQVAKGDKFDPKLHEAMTTVSIDNVKDLEIDQVSEVYQSGWILNGKLLRAAKVVVVTSGQKIK